MKIKGKSGLTMAMLGALALAIIFGTGTAAAQDDPQPGIVPIADSCEQPTLGLNQQNIYWASFDDYMVRLLSVDIAVPNLDGVNAYEVTVVGGRTLGGASLVNVPIAIGDIPVTTTSPVVTLKYSVPPGLNAFAAYLYGTAEDSCGNVYYCPGPYQGV